MKVVDCGSQNPTAWTAVFYKTVLKKSLFKKKKKKVCKLLAFLSLSWSFVLTVDFPQKMCSSDTDVLVPNTVE